MIYWEKERILFFSFNTIRDGWCIRANGLGFNRASRVGLRVVQWRRARADVRNDSGGFLALSNVEGSRVGVV